MFVNLEPGDSGIVPVRTKPIRYLYLGGMLGYPFPDSTWLAMLLTAIEVAVGTWFICLGPKRTIAYLLIVLLMSAMGSLVFYQLCVF